jgi:hypothetical protein
MRTKGKKATGQVPKSAHPAVCKYSVNIVVLYKYMKCKETVVLSE